MGNSSIKSLQVSIYCRKDIVLYDAWSQNCKTPVKAFPYAWSVFFRLTDMKCLDRLPQVFTVDLFIAVSLTSYFIIERSLH